MYDKIEQGKHIKKQNNIEVENTLKNKPRSKKSKEVRIQQLNV
jgi:aspartyl/asparaginyl-tRNA synthetase